jgi:thiol-disulfide isomerase/thioredoxin
MVFALLFTGSDLYQNKNLVFPKKESKATVVVFLSAKCPCSASHEKTLEELSQKYSKEGFEFVAVHSNQNESIESAKEHFKSAGINFPIVEDRGAKIANELKALKTPHAYIIQKEKIVYEGGVDDSADAAEAKIPYLANALEELKMNKPITVAKARALGCQIKR